MARGSGRQRILSAAQSEIQQSGCIGLRIDRVADTAKINKRMIYHYFNDRDGLIQAALGAFVHTLLRANISDELKGFVRALYRGSIVKTGHERDALDPEVAVESPEVDLLSCQHAMVVLVAEGLSGGPISISEYSLTSSEQRQVAGEIMQLVMPRIFLSQGKPVYRLQSDSKPTS